jgi:ABC-type transporter Mla maintaining outer membrane lipid asymmetry ATPase subunit MlaF
MEPASVQTSVPIIRMEEVAVGSQHDMSLVVAEGIDWEVNAEDYWVVAGLHGSGKSDFLMMTGGLMPPLRGRYWFCGEPMPIFEEARLKDRLRLGLVFETGQLFNQLTVRENIALPLRYHRNLTAAEAEGEVQKMLDATGLIPFADSAPGDIGRNWQKRVGLARALMLKPELLLVDNPLAGLDLRHANWWLGFLGQLSRGQGVLGGYPLTLVVTTADLRPWKDRARQFALLEKQRFRILGGWAQLGAASPELVQELLTAETRNV